MQHAFLLYSLHSRLGQADKDSIGFETIENTFQRTVQNVPGNHMKPRKIKLKRRKKGMDNLEELFI